MNLTTVREHFPHASVRGGVFTVRDSFFYTSGRTAQDLVNEVRAVFPTAVVLDSGEVWKDFRGGAPVARQSHWWVKFTQTTR